MLTGTRPEGVRLLALSRNARTAYVLEALALPLAAILYEPGLGAFSEFVSRRTAGRAIFTHIPTGSPSVTHRMLDALLMHPLLQGLVPRLKFSHGGVAMGLRVDQELEALAFFRNDLDKLHFGHTLSFYVCDAALTGDGHWPNRAGLTKTTCERFFALWLKSIRESLPKPGVPIGQHAREIIACEVWDALSRSLSAFRLGTRGSCEGIGGKLRPIVRNFLSDLVDLVAEDGPDSAHLLSDQVIYFRWRSREGPTDRYYGDPYMFEALSAACKAVDRDLDDGLESLRKRVDGHLGNGPAVVRIPPDGSPDLVATIGYALGLLERRKNDGAADGDRNQAVKILEEVAAGFDKPSGLVYGLQDLAAFSSNCLQAYLNHDALEQFYGATYFSAMVPHYLLEAAAALRGLGPGPGEENADVGRRPRKARLPLAIRELEGLFKAPLG